MPKRRDNKRCEENIQSTVKFTGILLGMVGRILKSIFFNLFMLLLGMAVGYAYVGNKVHWYATHHTYTEYVDDIDEKFEELRDFDMKYAAKQEEIRTVLKLIKCKMAHEEGHECDLPVLRRLITDK